MEKAIPTLDALEEEAKRFVHSLSREGGGATLVTLSGELGAGKTAFTKAVAKALGVNEVVNSPTFVLEKIYALPKGQIFKRLVHIDAYRLEDGEDLGTLGFDELMKDTDNLILLEWPERVRNMLPAESAAIAFRVSSSGAHTLSYG